MKTTCDAAFLATLARADLDYQRWHWAVSGNRQSWTHAHRQWIRKVQRSHAGRRQWIGGRLVVLFLLGSAYVASACTFSWEAVTSNTDGTPAQLSHYTLYATGNGQPPVAVAITGPTTTTVQLTCRVATYTVTATSELGLESAPSNAVIVSQPKSVNNVKVGKP